MRASKDQDAHRANDGSPSDPPFNRSLIRLDGARDLVGLDLPVGLARLADAVQLDRGRLDALLELCDGIRRESWA